MKSTDPASVRTLMLYTIALGFRAEPPPNRLVELKTHHVTRELLRLGAKNSVRQRT